jgi:hypothetical protein
LMVPLQRTRTINSRILILVSLICTICRRAAALPVLC